MRYNESASQRALITWWDYAHRGFGVPKKMLFAVPNQGGKGREREGGQLKAMGLRAGVSDLFLAVPRGGYAGLFIEMKTPKGRVSEEQKEFQAHAIAQGYWATVARGWDQARAEIESYLKGAK
jgi:hypothetical protein